MYIDTYDPDSKYGAGEENTSSYHVPNSHQGNVLSERTNENAFHAV